MFQGITIKMLEHGTYYLCIFLQPTQTSTSTHEFVKNDVQLKEHVGRNLREVVNVMDVDTFSMQNTKHY
jgi:hypothetical protein